MVGSTPEVLEPHKEKELAVHLDHIYSKSETTRTLPPDTQLLSTEDSSLPGDTPTQMELPAISITVPDPNVEVMHFDCDPFSELSGQMLSPEKQHCLSPASSDAGYDSSFSVSSPSSSVWDDTLTELFPSLV